MAFTEQVTQSTAPIDFIPPTNAGAASINSTPGIDMSKFKRAIYFIQNGLMTATGTLDARLQSSPSSTFASNVVNITGTNIAQILSSAGNNNSVVSIEVRSDQIIQQNPTHKFLRLNTTVGTAAVNFGAIGYGCESEQKPANQFVNTTLVTQQVVCNT